MGDSEYEPRERFANQDPYDGLTADEMVDCAMLIAGVYDEYGEPDYAY